MRRRRFLQTALAAPAVLGSFSACNLNGDRRPNILFVISDDQSYPHASAYGCKFVSTPGFDRVAKEGVLFNNTFVSAPSCCPSRGSVLSGQDFFRLQDASMNHTVWPSEPIPLYTDTLADFGYHVGYTGKGWGPGNWKVSGRKESPSGPEYNQIKQTAPGQYVSNIDYAANFEAFLDSRPKETAFCFWVGFQEPHREFDEGIAAKNGRKLEAVEVPGFLPDVPETRGDVADYAFEIEHADGHLVRMLGSLERRGELDHTIVIVTSDNGMAFPRAKGNLYDYGTRMPMAVRWGERVQPGRVVDDFVSFRDIAPTILEAAGLRVPGVMTGQSLMFVLDSPESGQVDPLRVFAVYGIERHFPGSRPDGAGYPSRAIRTSDFLLIRNYTPDQNPVGDHPGPSYPDGEPVGGYGDTDGGPSKTFLFQQREKYPELFEAAFGKRPAEELYLVKEDPFNLKNVAEDPQYDDAIRLLRAKLDDYLKMASDPRVLLNGAPFDETMRKYPVIGSAGSTQPNPGPIQRAPLPEAQTPEAPAPATP